ncbi:hypothetical protein D3C75_497250 [compost metagenome]
MVMNIKLRAIRSYLHRRSSYRTQMTLYAKICHFYDAIGLHRRYWLKKHHKYAFF